MKKVTVLCTGLLIILMAIVTNPSKVKHKEFNYKKYTEMEFNNYHNYIIFSINEQSCYLNYGSLNVESIEHKTLGLFNQIFTLDYKSKRL